MVPAESCHKIYEEEEGKIVENSWRGKIGTMSIGLPRSTALETTKMTRKKEQDTKNDTTRTCISRKISS